MLKHGSFMHDPGASRTARRRALACNRRCCACRPACSHTAPRHARRLRAAEVAPAVWGGSDAPKGRYPWMVSIAYYASFGDRDTLPFCGGSLISERLVLTAAQ